MFGKIWLHGCEWYPDNTPRRWKWAINVFLTMDHAVCCCSVAPPNWRSYGGRWGAIQAARRAAARLGIVIVEELN